MDLHLNEDQRLIVDMVHDFAAKELQPTAAYRDETGEFPLDIYRKMAELGLMGMNVPEAYGGSETGAVAYALSLMEISYGDASVAVTTSVTNMVNETIFKFGTEEQRKKFCPIINHSEYPIGAFALTEPGAGSDPGSMSTKAVRDGDEWVINGSKLFITSGAYASAVIVMARSLDIPGPKGISAFLVEKGTPGMIHGKDEHKMGLKGSNTAELLFEDCRIPAENMLGKEGEGFKIAMTALNSGRIGVASQAWGIGKRALDLAVSYSKEREQFGKPISRLQAIQWKLADMGTELEAGRLLILQAASMKDQKLPFVKQASMAKLYCSESANRVVRESFQIHGGYGFIKEYEIERLYRDVPVTTIYEGTSEVQRIVISRQILDD